MDAVAKLVHAARYGNPCPHCETWDADDCLNGNGCPTPDGLNGERIRAELEGIGDKRS